VQLHAGAEEQEGGVDLGAQLVHHGGRAVAVHREEARAARKRGVGAEALEDGAHLLARGAPRGAYVDAHDQLASPAEGGVEIRGAIDFCHLFAWAVHLLMMACVSAYC
jgi:hypothetical protein